MNLTRQTHQLISDYFINKPKILAIDATCGNGHDTEFLCRQGFKRVIGFDIQEQAIKETQSRLKQSELKATLIQQGHEKMDKYIDDKVDCVMFNFGYLPKADKSITTQTQTSLDALSIALKNLSDTGLVSLMCYPGHPEGALETVAIQNQIKLLNNEWQVDTHLTSTPKPTSPISYLIYPSA